MNLHTVNTLQMNPSATFEPENSLSKFASILARPYHMSTEL